MTMSLIFSDIQRMGGGKRLIISSICKFVVLFRIGSYLKTKGIFYKPLYIIVSLIYRHYQYRVGCPWGLGTKIGGGIKICHYPGIIINSGAVIGKNFTVFQGCTIGSTYGPKGGVPVLGDNVVMAANSTVIGNVHIGNNVMIGAGAVVTRDVPDNAVVAGVPAKIINMNGEEITSYYK